jgi:hypothetical protein
VHPFLDARTAAKIRFIDATTASGAAELAALIDVAQLDSSLGGTAQLPWDFGAFSARAAAEEAEAAAQELAAQQQAAQAAAQAAQEQEQA